MSLGRLPRIVRTASFGLAVLYALLFAASVTILGAIVYWTVSSSFERQMTTRIEAQVELLKEELRSEGNEELLEEVSGRNQLLSFEYLLLDPSGRRLAGTLPVIPTAVGWSDIPGPSDISGEQHARVFRVLTVPLTNGMRLSVADDYGSLDDLRHAWLEACVWVLIGFLLLSLIGGLLLSRGFLTRVDAIRRTAETIMSGDLTSRIPLRGTDDNLDLLSLTLNQMMDRIQARMESVSQVSNDIAHALRTPLGRLQQKLEAARIATKGNLGGENAIDAAQLEIERILETCSALLRIAQIEVGARHAGFGDVELSSLFTSVCEAYAPVAEDEGKAIIANIVPSSTVPGDNELLTEMLANLLDNAIRHTPEGAQIEVSLARDHSRIIASVADDGPGVPHEAQDKIFQRFYRLERSSKIEGNGLGLSLVAAVANLHDVQLSVEDNAPGLRITMTFDAAVSSTGSQKRGGARGRLLPATALRLFTRAPELAVEKTQEAVG
jgi:signal transduction histidine kinase